MSEQKKERYFHYYRKNSEGGKDRYRFVLTDDFVFLRDEPAESISRVGADGVTPVNVGSEKAAVLKAGGIEFKSLPGGGKVITKVSPMELAVTKFFHLQTPCFFPECEGLRKVWKNKLEHAKDGGEDCPPCVEGKLMRQFRGILEEPLARHLKLEGETSNSNGPTTRKS